MAPSLQLKMPYIFAWYTVIQQNVVLHFSGPLKHEKEI